MSEEFGPLLKMFRDQAGRSRNKVAKDAGIDPSYLCRCEGGEREPPRAHIVESLARALHLSVEDQNRLSLAAGYAPANLMYVSWSDTLQSVADVLSDDGLSVEDRERFGSVIQSIAERWRGAPVQERQVNGAHR